MDFAKPNSQMREGNMEDDHPIEELEMANRDGVVITSNWNKGKTIEFTSHDEDNGKYFAKKKLKKAKNVSCKQDINYKEY